MDLTQIDLPNKYKSGLIQAIDVLKDVDGVGINKFTEKDVVRHELVQRIIKAYEKFDEEQELNKFNDDRNKRNRR